MPRPASALLAVLVSTLLRAQIGLHNEAPPPKPKSSESQDALSLLESITGQKVDRSKVQTKFKVPKPPPPKLKPVPWLNSASQQRATLLGGIFGSLLEQAFQTTGPAGPSPAELARAEAERQQAHQQELAELQAWAGAYSAQMNALVQSQRQRRTAQGQESMEGLRASLSDGWDSGRAPMAGGGLAAALSDPMVVDLSGSRTFTPSLLREANGTKRTTPISADDLIKRREAAQARLKAMMVENKDLRVLGQRFFELEAQLTKLKKEATGLGADGRAIQRDMDYWGWRIDQATQACMERGTSLFTDVLLPKGTAAGLKRLQQNPKLWSKFLHTLSDVNEFSEFATTVSDRYDAAGEAMDWVKAKHSLMQNVDFVATNLQNVSSKLEPVSLHWTVGKAIVGTSVDLAAELDGWGAILERQGDAALTLQKQKVLMVRIEAVVRQLQESRTQMAVQLGVRPEDLIPPEARRGLGSGVPPV
jgi:hypothetical protein